MAKGRLEAGVLLAGMASGLTGIGAIGIGFLELSEAACFGAGGALAMTLLAGSSRRSPDALYPARMQLARFRRSGKPADVLVVKLPPGPSIARGGAAHRCIAAASSVLRVTDGVAMVPSLGGSGLCAVLESDAGARTAIQERLRNACGSDIRMAWASSSEDGVTLETLIAAAVGRLPEPTPPPPRQTLRPLPVQRLIPRSLGPEKEPMRSAR
jgi:hypothetical protein